MSEQKLCTSKKTSRQTLKDKSTIISISANDSRCYQSFPKANDSDRDLAQGNYFFLAVCITLLVLVSTSWTQRSLMYREIEQVTKNIIVQVMNYYP